MPEPDERKPVVIELKDGETRDVDVLVEALCEQARTCLHVTARLACDGAIRVAAHDAGFYSFPLTPDPVRAAVQAERERMVEIAAVLFAERGYGGTTLAAFRTRAAIDAPTEPESEYERGHREGQEAMQECAVNYLYGVAEARANDAESAAVSLIRGSAKWINDWGTKEPAP